MGPRPTPSRREHMRSSQPSLGGASGMNSQSAPDASADTRARYLQEAVTLFMDTGIQANKGAETELQLKQKTTTEGEVLRLPLTRSDVPWPLGQMYADGCGKASSNSYYTL